MSLVLVEAVVLALAGAALGLGIASGALALGGGLGLNRSSQGFEFTLDLTAFAYTFSAAIVAALLTGLPPVLALVREDLAGAIREAGRQGAGGRAAQRLRGTLVVAQLALSVVLLVGAGLLARSFYGLLADGPGFNAGSVWTARFGLAGPRYADASSWSRFEQQILTALRASPGVAAAGFVSALPFSGTVDQGSTSIDGYVVPAGGAPPHANFRAIDEGYFAALGIPVVRGRNFAAHEAAPVAIVDETLAERYWPGGDAVGQRIRRERFTDTDPWFTIVGVVPAVKQASLAATDVKETVYWHYEQRPASGGSFVVRAAVPPAALAGVVAAAVAAVDPDVALFDARTMDERVALSLGPQRTPMILTLVFAGVALTLAVVGIYAVLAWAVAQRTGEIGVRMALGARAADIGRMILGQGGRLIAVGSAVGAAGALALGRLLAAQLPGVEPFDASVLLGTLVALAGTALLASWLPARRAARVDPLEALRNE